MTNVINKAILDKEIIEFTYIDKKGNRTHRVVEPYEMKAGKLFAYCLEKNSIRAFIITSIQSPSSTGETFNPRF